MTKLKNIQKEILKSWCTENKVRFESIDSAWTKLIETAVKTKTQKSFNVKLPIQIDGETWTTYGAEVSHRDILFFCKQGTATFLVDSYGEKNTVELFDWSKDND